MKKQLENIYSSTLGGTFKVLSPIKKIIINTNCEVHLFIQRSAMDILKIYSYDKEYELLNEYILYINEGIVWADQDFKSYYHFYNPKYEKGKLGDNKNAMTVAINYYNKAIEYFKVGNYQKSMFYFGATCHLIQDLTIPQHAKGTLLDNHIQFETYVKLNYKKIKKFKSTQSPIILDGVKQYADYNSSYALKIDCMYRNIKELNTKFYLTAIKSITLAQRSTAGCMIMFYRDLLFQHN